MSNLDNDDVMFFQEFVISLEQNLSNVHLPEGLHIIKAKLGVKKWQYDTTKKFQDSWATKFPWVKLCVRLYYNLHIVKCIICNEVERKDKVLSIKWDSLVKHACHRKDAKDLRTL
jgi:hypothetical protein